MTRRALLGAAAAAGATVLTRRAFADPTQLRITRHRVPWSGEKKIRIVHLTDIHVGWATPAWLLAKTAEICHTLEPDAVVLTGDYVNHSLKHVDRLKQWVASLPKPIIATLGNHDHYSGAHGVALALIEGGAEVLSNRSIVLDGPGWSLPVVGIDDGRTRHHEVNTAFRGVQQAENALVLSHFPSIADEIMQTGGKLVLSGHTHGGQLVIPGVTRALSRVAGNKYFHGWYAHQESELYVSAGIGNSLEGLRSGETAIAEVAVFELDPRARKRELRVYRGA